MSESISAEEVRPLMNALLVWFLLAMILANLGGNMYGPLLPLYLEELGASVTQVGLFFTLSQIVPLGLQIFGGWISDSLGRLRAIAIGSVIGVLAYVPLMLAPRWEWVLLASVLGAFTGALVAPSFEAFIAEQTQEHERGRLFGLSQAIFSIVGVLGPLIGGHLAQERGFRFMLLVAALLYLVATVIRVVMARRLGGSKKTAQLSWTELKANLGTLIGLIAAGGLVTWILLTDSIRDVSFALSMNLLPVYLQQQMGLNMAEIGTLNSLFGLAMMLTLFPAGMFSDHLGERWGIALGMALVGIGMSLLVFLPASLPFWAYGIGWGLAGIGAGLVTPAYQSLLSKVVPQELRGTAFGLLGTSLGLVALPAPWLGGVLWDKIHPRFPFVITIAACFAVILPIMRKFHLKREGD